jgi:hypothetical protein
MQFSDLLRFLRGCAARERTHRPGRGFVPRLEALEDRAVPATFTVTNLDDSGGGSLRQAILDANSNPGADLIRFSHNVKGTITLSSQLAITDDVAIIGPGAHKLTVSGGGATRVFAVLPASLAGNPFVTPTAAQVATSPEVTIAGLTVADGLATNALGFDPTAPSNPGFSFGGGLYNLGGTVHLDRVCMVGNQAAGVVTAGGAVANEFGGVLTVLDSYFEDNTSAGFVIGAAGAITSDLGPTTTGPTGPPSVSIDHSTFVGNTAQATAGHINAPGGEFTGLGGGGALLNLTGSMTITRSHFEDNVAQGGSLAIPGVSLGGPGFGGAILTGNASPFGIAQATLNVSGSIFIGNTATGGAGATGLPGGEGAGGAISAVNGAAVVLSRNAFHDNAATGGAGGENAAGGNATGGAVSASGGAGLDLEGNLWIANVAAGGAGNGTGAAGVGRGGALGLYSVALAGFSPALPTGEVDRDLFFYNQALGGLGGAIYNEGELTVRDALIFGNKALGGMGVGGGIYNLGVVELIDSLIFANFASTSDNNCFGC